MPSDSLVPEDLIETLLMRVMARHARGELPQVMQLPASKADFPKLLCLDFNKWIDLGRAHYGRADGEKFRPALDAVKAAVEKGKLVVPIMSPNAMEASAPADRERRLRLAKFMVELSRNHSARNEVVAKDVTLYAAVCRTQGVNAIIPDVRTGLLERSMSAAFGPPPPTGAPGSVLAALIAEVQQEPEMTVIGLVDAIDREVIERNNAADEEGARINAGIRDLDAHMTTEQRRHIELTNLFQEGTVADLLRAALCRAGIEEQVFFEWLKAEDHLLRFVEQVPPIDVLCTLMLHRDKNPKEKSKRNDGRDLSLFEVALPYANVIVSEKLWGHVATNSGLAKKYGTIVRTDLRDLPDVLRAEGCT